jgi:hypothetical protein
MAEVIAIDASDPSADAGVVAWHRPGRAGVLARNGGTEEAPGPHPAVGGGLLAWIRDGSIEVRSLAGQGFRRTLPAPGADAVAVSARWVAWRARREGGDDLIAVPLGGGPAVPADSADAPAQLGRPSLAGDVVVWHVAGPGGSRIRGRALPDGPSTTLRRERRRQLLNPSALEDGLLLYVGASHKRQELRLGPLTKQSPKRDGVLWDTVPTGRRDRGHEPGKRHDRHGWPRRMWRRPPAGRSDTLWTTALAPDAAYVTRLRQDAGAPLALALVRVDR